MTYKIDEPRHELDDGHVSIISSSEERRREYLEVSRKEEPRLSEADKAEDNIINKAWSNVADSLETLEESLSWAQRVFRDRIPQTFVQSPLVVKQYKSWLEEQKKEIDQLRERKARNV